MRWLGSGWRSAALAAVVTGVVVAPFAFVGYQRSVERVELEFEAAVEHQLAEAVRAYYNPEFSAPSNSWNVNPVDQWVAPMAEDAWTSPPLFRLGEVAIANGQVQSEYEFDGRWLAVGTPVGGNNAVVTVLGVDERIDQIGAARTRWLGFWLAALAAAGLIGLLLGRRVQAHLEAPVKRAHLVNRDFIADAAHELRTPLSVIQASAGHALARERSAGEYRESLTEILTAAERAGSSVGDLLEFARFEAGQASLRLAPLRLDLLVEEVAVSVRADDTSVEVEPSEVVVVEADYNLIRQVVDNLTRNAVARADKVTLSVHADEDMARVDVVDNGPGFDPGMIDYVFERFRRGDRSGAAGLGLSIARTIVDLHGGRCQARNVGADDHGDDHGDDHEDDDVAGAMVSFWLPIRPD